jgi:hypothetical protein
MATPTAALSERVLQAAISKEISERLGTLGREFRDMTKNMNEADVKATGLMLLEMFKVGFDEFYVKIKTRVESGKKDQSE